MNDRWQTTGDKLWFSLVRFPDNSFSNAVWKNHLALATSSAEHDWRLVEGTSSRQPKILCLASAYSSSLCFKDFTNTRFWLKLSSEGETSAGRTSGLFNIFSNCSCSLQASPSSSVDLSWILLALGGTATASGRFKIVTLTSDWFLSSAGPSWAFIIESGSRGGSKFSLGGGTLRFKFFREIAVSSMIKELGNWRGTIGDCSLGCVTMKTGSATACQTCFQDQECTIHWWIITRKNV